MVVNSDCLPLSVGSARNTLDYPAPGLVEQDAANLWANVTTAIQQALSHTRLSLADIAAIGVTAQRSSIVVWNKRTVEAVCPIVSWQDLRAIETASALAEKGFLIVHQMAAAKLESVIDGIENGRQQMRAGDLVFGNVDTFVIAKMSAGKIHAMDLSHLSATGYFDFAGGLNEALIDVQNLSVDLFPNIGCTAQNYGTTAADVVGAEVVIGAIVADQQAAMAAEGCTKPGMSKITYGTSATLNVNSGQEMKLSSGTYPLVLKNTQSQIDYMVEGMVITAGAVFDWLAHGLELIDSASAAEEVAGQVDDSASVFVLPALQGLGSPYMVPNQSAVVGGLTRGARKPHVVRAALEGVAARVREAFDQIYADLPELAQPQTLRVDGGMTRNNLFMQIQADILGIPIERHAVTEATALGAAIYAGETASFWRSEDIENLRKTDRTFEPQWSEDQRETFYAQWRKMTADVRTSGEET